MADKKKNEFETMVTRVCAKVTGVEVKGKVLNVTLEGPKGKPFYATVRDGGKDAEKVQAALKSGEPIDSYGAYKVFGSKSKGEHAKTSLWLKPGLDVTKPFQGRQLEPGQSCVYIHVPGADKGNFCGNTKDGKGAYYNDSVSVKQEDGTYMQMKRTMFGKEPMAEGAAGSTVSAICLGSPKFKTNEATGEVSLVFNAVEPVVVHARKEAAHEEEETNAPA